MLASSQQARGFRYAILVLCLCVLSFAATVKLSQYSASAPNGPSPVAASKLWVDGQKMDLSLISTDLSLVCLASLLLAALVLTTKKQPRTVPVTPSPRRLSLFERHRFLRPPPTV